MSDGIYIRQGKASALNITTATVVSTVPADFARGQARLCRVTVLVAGSTAGSVNDAATLAAVASSNLVYTIPNVGGPVLVDFPMQFGIVVTPGTGQTVAITYD